MKKYNKKKLELIATIIAATVVAHAVYLFLGQINIILQIINDGFPPKAFFYILAHILPICMSIVFLCIFGIIYLKRKKVLFKILFTGAFLGWIGCIGWFICEKIIESNISLKPFYSSIFLYPIFLVWFFSLKQVRCIIK